MKTRTKRNDLLRAKLDWVKGHYTGRVKDGSVFGSSEKRQPVSFVLGEGTLIPGFELAVLGMAPGVKKTVTLAPEDGYGLVSTWNRSAYPRYTLSPLPRTIPRKTIFPLTTAWNCGGRLDGLRYCA